MKNLIFVLLSFLSTGVFHSDNIPVLQTGGQAMPNVWIDKNTGHEIIKLSRRTGNNNSFYFHNNPFLKTPDGKGWEMIYYGSTSNGNQLFAVDLQNFQSTQVTHFNGRMSGE